MYKVTCYMIRYWLYLDRNSFKWIVNVDQTKNEVTSIEKNIKDFNFFQIFPFGLVHTREKP